MSEVKHFYVPAAAVILKNAADAASTSFATDDKWAVRACFKKMLLFWKLEM
jgi:hypothetical protein